MTIYINTYETWQVYGGPEEGGWFIEAGEPVQSVVYSDEDEDTFLAVSDDAVWEERYELLRRTTLAYTQGKAPTPKATGYGGYTFLPGSDEPSTYQEDNSFRSCFEDHFAEAYPTERPRYE